MKNFLFNKMVLGNELAGQLIAENRGKDNRKMPLKTQMRILSMFFCLVFIIHNGFGQTKPEEILVKTAPTEKVFTDLNEALLAPEKVIRLSLNNQDFTKTGFEFLPKFKNLQYLSLRNDHITTLPPQLSQLSNLKVLDLGANNLKVLPKSFIKLQNLEELYLDNEPSLSLKQEMPILGQLPKLRILHLDNNGVYKLPTSINKLTHLEQLYLSNNLLRVVPHEIKGLKNLKYLDINHNPLPPIVSMPNQEGGLRIKF